MQAQALWTVGSGAMALLPETLREPGPGEVVLRAVCSGISRGTEATVLRGGVPEPLGEVMRCPHQSGSFPFPVKYGYALVGTVIDGPPDRIGETCFALHPHQSLAVLAGGAALPLPQGLPPLRAVLAANMETALNVLWDAGIGPGDRVLVVGAGVVGLLIAVLAAAIPATEVTVSDTNPDRGPLAEALGLDFAGPDACPRGVDLAVNASGGAAGLQAALDAAGQEATVIEASWHGDAAGTLHLGGGFHPRRLTLKSSQVGHLPPARAPRWTHRRRLSTALRLLAAQPALEALISHEIPFAEAPARLPALLTPGADALCPVLTYDQTGDTHVRA